jgi:hypothetical protein
MLLCNAPKCEQLAKGGASVDVIVSVRFRGKFGGIL